jgi:hypothetical protein
MRPRFGLHTVAIIPLGHDSRRDSSGLPEGCSPRRLTPSQRERLLAAAAAKRSTARKLTRRAGPALPSYLALHHAGFSVPRVLPHERWALTPPFHPCQTKRAVRRRLAGFPARCHRAALHRRYILCGTIRDSPHRTGLNPAPHAEACNSASRQTLRGSPPGVTRRVALYPEPAVKQVRGFLPDRLRTVSGLSSRPAIFQWPDQRLPGPPANYIIARFRCLPVVPEPNAAYNFVHARTGSQGFPRSANG